MAGGGADQSAARARCMLARMRGLILAGFVHPQTTENEDADRGRQIAAGAIVVDLPDQRRQRGVIAVGDLVQSVPELVFQRHARLVPIDDDGTLDNSRPFGNG